MRNAHIGDAKLQDTLQRRRLPGARREPAAGSLAKSTPTEDGGVLYTLGNHMLPTDDGQSTPVIRSDGVLRVHGPKEGVGPHALVLYYPAERMASKPSAPAPAAKREPALPDLDGLELTPPADDFPGDMERLDWDMDRNGDRDG